MIPAVGFMLIMSLWGFHCYIIILGACAASTRAGAPDVSGAVGLQV